MTDLTSQLSDAAKSGVFHLMREPGTTELAAKTAGLVVRRMDIGHAHDKGDFMAHIAKALAFPEHFGKNLDALNDCLTDLEWVEGGAARGYVLVFERSKHFAAGHRHEFDDCMAVLRAVSDYWRDHGKPFWAFIHGAEGWKSGLPEWPAA